MTGAQRFMAAAVKSEQRIVLHGISWRAYETLLREVGESHVRLTYDDGDLEIMTLSFGHENAGEWIGRLIFFLALELRLALCSGGATTLKKSLQRKGLEPDKSFWIKNERRMRGKKKWKPEADPPPDVVVEIDISSSSLDRFAIYAALQVPEIWWYDGVTFKVLVLAADGEYVEKTKSLAFPNLPIKAFARFVKRLGEADEVSLMQEFVEWVRAEVVAKNGRK